MRIPTLFSSAVLLGAVSISLTGAPQSFGQVVSRPQVKTVPAKVGPVTTVTPITNDTGTTTAATVPVGFTQYTVTPATDANTPSSQVFSIPFYNPAAYAAAVSSVDNSTSFSISSAAWTANQFAQTGSPYLVHFQSGNSTGRYFLIQSNTTTQVTVYPRGYDLTAIAAAADTFEIVPANTLGSVFGTSSVPFQTGATYDVADNLYLWNGSGFSIYYHNGTNWKLSGNLSNQNSTILYPDEGIFLVRRNTAALALTFIGTVPSTTERSDVPGLATGATGTISTFVSNRFPVDTTLTAIGFQNLPNWKSGATYDVADNVYIWNGASWVIYFYNGTNWKASGILGAQDSKVVPTDSAVFVVRQSAASGTAATLVQALPYTL